MQVKNNYNECLTNLACSIEKYFGLIPKHNTLSYIDELLEKEQPENVVVILFDGLGSKILDKTLKEDCFLRQHKYKDLTTVFPATTTAATTSMQTGLNPIEHGYLGWNVYVEPIDKVITLYLNTEKGKLTPDGDFLALKNKYYKLKSIPEQIEEQGLGQGIELFPFQKEIYHGLDDMLVKIKSLTTKPGKKYIYAYDEEPDHTMHDFGPDSKEAKELIKERNEKLEKLCKDLANTIVFVIADHGHKKVEPIFLNDYKDILAMLERTTSLEQRAASFKIKEDYKNQFVDKFNEYFGKDFTLYKKEEVIESNLFGDGKPHPLFTSALGDYIAIADESNKCLIADGDSFLVSQHAGSSPDEIYVPLIIINKK